MKDTTLKKILLIMLVCAFVCAGFGLLIVSMGKSSYIVAFIAGMTAVFPLCAELMRVDKRIAKNKK